MKAAIRERYGRPEDVVELRDIDLPTPVDDQVLVRVQAASINRADLDGLGPKPGFARFGTAIPIFVSMLVGPVVSIGSSRWTGLLLWWKPFDPADVAKLTDLIATGKVTPVVDRRFPLTEIVEALRYVNDKHARGKVIITMT